MDIKGNGVEIRVNAAEQTDQWLIDAAKEIREAAEARGLEVPALAGVVAIEGAQETKLNMSDVKESLFGQLETAFMGYMTVAEHINDYRKATEQFERADPETVEAEFKTWITDEKADYITKTMEQDPDLRWTLVATPNVLVNGDELIKLAEEFGKAQPNKTHIYESIVKSYSPAQLSGTNPNNGNSVQFSLVPSKLNPDLYGTVAQQRAALAKLQADMPDLRVPSFLEDLTYWQTLRSGGDNLAHGDVSERTYIRHFDLPEQRIDGDVCVLYSCVRGYGGPYVGGSDVRIDYYGRALVG